MPISGSICRTLIENTMHASRRLPLAADIGVVHDGPAKQERHQQLHDGDGYVHGFWRSRQAVDGDGSQGRPAESDQINAELADLADSPTYIRPVFELPGEK